MAYGSIQITFNKITRLTVVSFFWSHSCYNLFGTFETLEHCSWTHSNCVLNQHFLFCFHGNPWLSIYRLDGKDGDTDSITTVAARPPGEVWGIGSWWHGSGRADQTKGHGTAVWCGVDRWEGTPTSSQGRSSIM